MTIIYIFAKGKSGAGDGFELRHSLRSIAMYGTGVDRVAVVGYCPAWLSDAVVQLPYFDGMPFGNGNSMGGKALNMMANCVYAVNHLDGDEFLVSMDDHFYLKPTDFENYPYFVRDRVDRPWRHELPKDEWSNTYNAVLSATRAMLERKGLPVMNFAIHRNMHVRRDIVDECRDEIARILRRELPAVEPFAWWNNILLGRGEIEPVIVEDNKPLRLADFNPAWDVFSTPDFQHGTNFARLLEGLYPEKSLFEK